jgi:hypothetical protein
LQATRSRWQSLTQQTYSRELTEVSVPAETDHNSHQFSLMSIMDQYRSTILKPILNINRK